MAETKIMTLAAQQHYDEKIKAFIASEDEKLVNGQIKTNADAIAAINNAEIGILAQAKAFASEEDAKVQGTVNALSGKVGVVPEGSTVMDIIENIQENAYDDSALVERINGIDGKVTTLVGSDANKSVRAIANEELAKQLVAEGAKESLDTLAEIAAWIQNHPDDASAMNKAIDDLEALVGALPDSVSATTIVGYIQEVVAAEKSRAEGVEAGLDGRLVAVEGAVSTVDSRIATAKSEAAADATSKANAAEANAKSHANDLNTAMNTRVEALEAIDHDHANKAELDKIADGDVAKWNSAQANAEATAAGALSAAKTELEGKISDGDKANKDLIDGHATRIEALENKVGDGFSEITNAEIDAMF